MKREEMLREAQRLARHVGAGMIAEHQARSVISRMVARAEGSTPAAQRLLADLMTSFDLALLREREIF
ncbi:MAG: hypothetical protein KGH75_00855 [Rhodospirillales bacterium]|nr:hypothetical protein [Rhodospirillales bacterium]